MGGKARKVSRQIPDDLILNSLMEQGSTFTEASQRLEELKRGDDLEAKLEQQLHVQLNDQIKDLLD